MKLILTLDSKFDKTLTALSKFLNKERDEIIRIGVVFLTVYKSEIKKGNRICVVDREDKILKEITINEVK